VTTSLVGYLVADLFGYLFATCSVCILENRFLNFLKIRKADVINVRHRIKLQCLKNQ